MIEKEVLLRCSCERAFELFTAHASEWWPPSRRHTGDPASRIVMEASGPFYETGGGRQVELGRVREWAPPARLVLDWYPGTDPEHPTQVEVRFVPEGNVTRVCVLHGPTEASAALFPLRASRYEASWDLVLAALGARA